MRTYTQLPKWPLIAMLILLAGYTYYAMLGLTFLTQSSFVSIIQLCVFVLAIVVLVMYGYIPLHSKMNKMWMCWLLYYVIVFFLLGLRGKGISDFFQVCFAPATYFIGYCISSKLTKATHLSSLWAIPIMVIAAYIIQISSALRQIDINDADAIAANNLYFFMLCITPFVFMLKNNTLKNVLLLVSVVFCITTVKRSAFIAMALIVVLYAYYLLFMNKQQIGTSKYIFLLLFICGGYYLVSNNLSSATEVIIGRMDSMGEDQGTGRIPLYQDVISNMTYRNDLPAWVVGNGKGSIYATGHTNAHNDALQMLYEFGVVGLFLYFWLIILILKRTIYLFKKKHPLFMPYAASVIITIMLGLVSNLVVFYSYFAFITALWGIVEGTLYQELTEKQ